MRQIYKCTGGSYGGVNIDTAFYKLLKEATGEDQWLEFLKNNRGDELLLRRNFELEKRGVSLVQLDIN